MPSVVAACKESRPLDQSDLILKAQKGDTAAMEQMIEQNLGLARVLAGRFCGKGAEFDDLFQTACIGLMKAVSNFNVALGLRFSTYAVPVILGELKRSFRDGGSVKVSRSLKENGCRVLRLQEQLTQELGAQPTTADLARESGFPVEEIVMMMEALTPPLSLSEPMGEGNLTRGELFAVDRGEEEMTALALKESLAQLTAEERLLISLRYFRGLTQQKTALVLRSSQVQVSRMERKILDKMQQLLREPPA